ncbi:MAG: zinc ribbon domain-containing protein [Oscillospiraceae bacterium]|nr:zinc ribbon domain-containing protein [Oscillospiraceae bacterium]
MGIRYCMHCGMPVSRKAVFCPECGASLKEAAPRKESDSAAPRDALKKPAPEGRVNRRKRKANKIAWLFAAGMTAAVCIAAFFILDAGEKIKYARSRRQENIMDAQRSATDHPRIRIPEISIPDISIPDIQIPEPPAAAFAVEGYETETNLKGDTVLYVSIRYTNEAEDEECFLTNFQISVQQEGARCKQTAGDPAKENHLTDLVQPDETVLISAAFIIQAEKEATVSVGAFFGKDNYLEQTVLPHSDGTVSAGA